MGFKAASDGLGVRTIESRYGPVRVDQRYDIPLLAGLSKDRKTMYVQRGVDLRASIDGHVIDRTPFLLVHEMEEALKEEGLDALEPEQYAEAHAHAEKMENNAARAAGLNVRAYEESWRPDLKFAAQVKDPHLPPDLIMKPYEHPHAKRARVMKNQF